MKKIVVLGVALLFVGGIIITNNLLAVASGLYTASDVIGQSVGGAPSFTTDYENNRVTPNATGLDSPNGLAIDEAAHRLFIADTRNHRVVVHILDASNNIIDRTPDYVLGQANFNERAAATTQNGLSSPEGMALDSTKKLLYVADTGNERVVVYDYATLSNHENAVNVIGQASFTVAATTVDGNTLNGPKSVALNSSAGILYVADTTNHRVLTFDVTAITNGESAVNVLGRTNFNGSLPFSTAAELNRPTAVTLGSGGRLFVSDSAHHRVAVFDVNTVTNGEDAVNVLGRATVTEKSYVSGPTSTATNLDYPWGLAYDQAAERLYVADERNSRVMIYDVADISDGEAAVNVLGQPDLTSYVSVGYEGDLSYPSALLLSNKTLYVATDLDHRVMVFDTNTLTNGEAAINILGQTNAQGGPRYEAFDANDTHPNASSQSFPKGIDIDRINHRLFVADWGNSRVLMYNLNSENQLIDRTADAVLGQPDMLSTKSFMTQNSMSLPGSVVYDQARQWLFVADSANGRVLIFDVASVANGENALHVLGQANFVTQDFTNVTQSKLGEPGSLVYDSSRKLLFVTDFYNSRILVFDVASVTNGENALYVLGQSSFTGDTSGASATQLNFPEAVEYDPVRKLLFVSDTFNHRVVVYNTTTMSNGMPASHVLGAGDLTTEGSGAATQSTLEYPEGLALDADSNTLYVQDGHSRILLFDTTSLTNGESAVGILGKSSYVDSASPSVSASSVNFNGDMLYDNIANKLYLADYHNNRTILYDFVRITSSTLPTAIKGQSYTRNLQHAGSQGTVTYQLASGALPSGMTLSSSGVLSGTPSQTGSYSFEVRATDNNGIAGNFTDKKTFTLVVSDDSDGDGASDATENLGPNNGDANGDGTPDVTQANVATNNNPVTGKHATVQSQSGTIKQFIVEDEADLSAQNEVASFPVGLNSFSVDGITPGSSTTVKVVYDQLYDTSTWTYMKYSPSTKAYTNMDSIVSYGTAVIGGKTVTTASYVLTDGQQYDEDGVANGVIVDPAGPAVLSNPGVPNTGFALQPNRPQVAASAGIVLGLAAIIYSTRLLYVSTTSKTTRH